MVGPPRVLAIFDAILNMWCCKLEKRCRLCTFLHYLRLSMSVIHFYYAMVTGFPSFPFYSIAGRGYTHAYV